MDVPQELTWTWHMDEALIEFYNDNEGSLLSSESTSTAEERAQLWNGFVKTFQRFHGAEYNSDILKGKWRNIRNAAGSVKRKLKKNTTLAPKEKWIMDRCGFLIQCISNKANSASSQTASTSRAIPVNDNHDQFYIAQSTHRQGFDSDSSCAPGTNEKDDEEVRLDEEDDLSNMGQEITSEFVIHELAAEEVITEDHTYADEDNSEVLVHQETQGSNPIDTQETSNRRSSSCLEPPPVKDFNYSNKSRVDQQSGMFTPDDILPRIKSQLEELQSEKEVVDMARFIWECCEKVDERNLEVKYLFEGLQ